MSYDPTQSLGERLHISYRAALGHDERSIFNQLPSADKAHWERAAVNFVARLSDAPADSLILRAHDALEVARDKMRGAVEPDDVAAYETVNTALYAIRGRS